MHLSAVRLTDPATGRQYGRACPRLAAGGRHGGWCVRLELACGAGWAPALRAHRDRQRAEAADHGPQYRASGLAFTNLNGDPMTPDRLTRTFGQLNTEAGLPPVRLHDLRHGAAALALAAGVGLQVVQEMLGHLSIVLTADTCTLVLPAVAHAAAEKVAMLVIRAGCLVPGTRRRRRRGRRVRRRGCAGHGQGRVRRSRAHPARQIDRPRSRYGKRVR